MDEISLFENNGDSNEPLAARMRPQTLDEYIGQDHIVGKGRLLRRAIAADQLTSVIFYGPPGSGKTTLARVIANHTKSNFLTLNAVLTGVADIRKAISDAEQQHKLYGKRTILFVDEVHRWNKSQQDALLPWVENGTIILIGATTENPFFEVNKALVSRSRVFQLKNLTDEDLINVARQALSNKERGYGNLTVKFEDGALEHLVSTANGDARSLLNALELAVVTTESENGKIYISKETAEESIQKKVVLYDKDGDYHYDIISAFIKSLRGRDPDAACYWLARMVKAGEDPSFIFRRMLISACEDTGLADPNAVSIVESCAQAFDRVGMPEGRYFLAHAALYLSTAPKSNSSMAFFDALSSVEKEDADVPNHLKDPSRDAEGFGHGAGYLYPHAYRDHWVAQQYLPTQLVGKVFYTPTTQGYEAKIRQEVLSRRELQISAMMENEKKEQEWWDQRENPHPYVEGTENLTFSPQDKAKDVNLTNADRMWKSRLETSKAQILLNIRNNMLQATPLLRHHRCLLWNADDALLIFEILRRTPEGVTCGICRNEDGISVLKQYAMTLPDMDKPKLTFAKKTNSANSLQKDNFLETLEEFKDIVFDRVFFRDVFANKQDIELLKDTLIYAKEKNFFSKDFCAVFSQRIPRNGQRISLLIKEQLFSDSVQIDANTTEILEKMLNAENAFFSDEDNPYFAWDKNTVLSSFKTAFNEINEKTEILKEKRILKESDVEKWFSPTSRYGECIEKALGKEDCTVIKKLLIQECGKKTFTWNTENILMTCRF